MNLVPCLTCGANIAKNAISCPICGAQNPTKKKRSWLTWVIGTVIGFAVLTAAIANLVSSFKASFS